jgi:hypothetical protein
MARIRSIKPEFWTSEQVMECSLNARLLFIGLWNFADDLGRLPNSTKTIRAQIFPGDDLSLDNIRGMINELSKNGLIVMYSVDDKDYLQVTGWQHQRIDKPQAAKHPAPLLEHSKNVQRTFPPDRIGREGKEDAASAAPDPEVELFRRGREVLGKQAGGLISKLLTAKQRNIPLARAALEQASTKSDPREYIGRIISGPKTANEPNWIDGIEGVL